MKVLPAVLAAALLSQAPARVAAAEHTLIVGVVHDQDGLAIGGAIVEALRADGTPLGRATVGTDGTFALEAPTPPQTLAATCRFCRATRVPFVPGTDVTIAVFRYTGLESGGPTSADLAALPPQTAAAAAELVPFTVLNGGALSDRGLGLGRDATVIDGLPLYRRLDGVPLAGALPASAIASVTSTDRTLQFASADPDAASVQFVPTSDLAGSVRTTGSLNTTAAYDRDRGDARFAGAGLAIPLAGGNLNVHVVEDATSDVRFSGAQATYLTASRRFVSAVSASAVQSDAYGAPESDVSFDAHLTNRGPASLTFGFQGRRSTGESSGGSGTQDDLRAYANATWNAPRTTLTLGLAADPLLLPDITLTQSLSDNTTLRAALHDDMLAPALLDAAPFAHDQLIELALASTDARRLSTQALVYDETTSGSVHASVRGAGLRAAYQLAPHLLVRTWLLHADTSAHDASPTFGDAYQARAGGDAFLSRATAWITYDGTLRIDVISRADGLDASIGTKLARYRITLGTRHVPGRHELVLSLAR